MYKRQVFVEPPVEASTVIHYNLLDPGYVGNSLENSSRKGGTSGSFCSQNGVAYINDTGVVSGYTFSAGDENIQGVLVQQPQGDFVGSPVGVFPESSAEQPEYEFPNQTTIKFNTLSLNIPPSDFIPSVSEGTIAPSVFWTIKPLPGYVVAASRFAQINSVKLGQLVNYTGNCLGIPVPYAQFDITSNFNPNFVGNWPPENPQGLNYQNNPSFTPYPVSFVADFFSQPSPSSMENTNLTTLSASQLQVFSTGWDQASPAMVDPATNMLTLSGTTQNALTFTDSSQPFAADNTVIVTYVNQPDFSIPYTPSIVNELNFSDEWNGYETLNANFCFSGKATPTILGQGGMPAIDINSYVDIVNPSSNGGTATVTGSTNTGLYGTANTTSVTSIIEKGGFTNEATVYSISGVVPESRSTVIATIRIDADTNKYFLNTPSLTRDSVLRANKINTNGIIKMSVKSVEKTNNKATAYILDIKYKNNVATSAIDGLKLNLNYKQQSIVTLSSIINYIKYGSDCLNRIGERRNIKIIGSANVPFVLTLEQFLNSDQKRDPYGSSILTKSFINHSIVSANGRSTPAINSTTGSSGVYSFDQTFPGLPLILKTLVNGAITTASKTLVLDKTDGVEVGDQLFYPSMPAVTSLKVASVTNSTTLILNQAITIADDISVEFKRSTSYDINITPLSSLGSGIPTTTPTYTINQYTDPTVTIRISTASHLYKINAQDLPGHGSIRQEYDTVYSGKAKKDARKILKSSNIKNKFNLTYLLDSESSKVFSAARVPFFSDSIPYDGLGTVAGNISRGSDWSNTINKALYFSNIKIYNTAITSTGAETITITATLEITNWGAEDMVFELDLDKIVTIS